MRASTVVFIVFFLGSIGYSQPYEFQLINRDTKLSTLIFETRSAVIISTDLKNDWKSTAQNIHRQLIRMKMDPVLYVHYDDFHAGTHVEKKFNELLLSRQVSQIFLIDIRPSYTQLAIIPVTVEGKADYKKPSWYQESNNLNDLLLQLALQIKRLDVTYSNFLTIEYPEIIDDLKIFEGKSYPNYPTRLTRATLAVALYPLLPQESSMDTVRINRVNRRIENLNAVIRSQFQDYPFPYEFVEDQKDDELYKNRYQYVMRILYTSGKTIKKLLNYEIEESEEDYVSIVPFADGTRTMKTIDAEQTVYKCYVQQTARSDVHVGRYWDADNDLSAAIRNFLLHLQNNVQ